MLRVAENRTRTWKRRVAHARTRMALPDVAKDAKSPSYTTRVLEAGRRMLYLLGVPQELSVLTGGRRLELPSYHSPQVKPHYCHGAPFHHGQWSHEAVTSPSLLAMPVDAAAILIYIVYRTYDLSFSFVKMPTRQQSPCEARQHVSRRALLPN